MKSKLIWFLILVLLVGAMVVLGHISNATLPHSTGCGCGSH